MRSSGRIRKAGILGAVTMVAVGGTTMAVAADNSARGSSGSTTYYACVTPVYKTMRLTTASATCPEGFRKISFAAKGEPGERGARGARGTRGAAGADGT
ncbi:MAG: hypothetical protein WC558_06185, partial [Patulibacter sp.]